MSHLISTKYGNYDIDTTVGAYEYLVHGILKENTPKNAIEIISFLYRKADKIDKLKKELNLEIEFLKTKFTNESIIRLAVNEKILYFLENN